MNGPAVEGEGISDAHAERVGEAALDDHPPVANPTAGGERRLGELCRYGIAAFQHGAGRYPVHVEECEGHGVRPAVPDDPRRTCYGGEIGWVGTSTDRAVVRDSWGEVGHCVGALSRCPGRVVRVAGLAVQEE